MVEVYYSDGMDVLNGVVTADGLLVTVAGTKGRAIVKLSSSSPARWCAWPACGRSECGDAGGVRHGND